MNKENIEIEKKFLVNRTLWESSVFKKNARRVYLKQGYLSNSRHATIRIRLKKNQGILTIKGRNTGLERSEYEYTIPYKDACQIFDNLCLNSISKYRYTFTYQNFIWEVDEFEGEQYPLIIAEVELENAQQDPTLPPFITRDVSLDFRYTNAQLAQKPFGSWEQT